MTRFLGTLRAESPGFGCFRGVLSAFPAAEMARSGMEPMARLLGIKRVFWRPKGVKGARFRMVLGRRGLGFGLFGRGGAPQLHRTVESWTELWAGPKVARCSRGATPRSAPTETTSRRQGIGQQGGEGRRGMSFVPKERGDLPSQKLRRAGAPPFTPDPGGRTGEGKFFRTDRKREPLAAWWPRPKKETNSLRTRQRSVV
jgi:hypothetical protein